MLQCAKRHDPVTHATFSDINDDSHIFEDSVGEALCSRVRY